MEAKLKLIDQQKSEFLLSESVDDSLPLCLVGRGTVKFLLDLSQRGLTLPAQLLVFIASFSFKSEGGGRRLLTAGITQSLVSLATLPVLPQDLRQLARSQLLLLLRHSESSRNQFLDATLSVLSDTSSFSQPSSLPDPRSQFSEGEGEGEEGTQTDSESLVQLDVEWRPRTGPSCRLSSSLLWARCPALRSIVEDFWERSEGQTRGTIGLQLFMDSSSQTLLSVCQFLYSGFLTLPSEFSDVLSLAKVSVDLEMPSLQTQTLDQIQQILSPKNLSSCLSFARDHSLTSLLLCCQNYQKTGRNSLPEFTLPSRDNDRLSPIPTPSNPPSSRTAPKSNPPSQKASPSPSPSPSPSIPFSRSQSLSLSKPAGKPDKKPIQITNYEEEDDDDDSSWPPSLSSLNTSQAVEVTEFDRAMSLRPSSSLNPVEKRLFEMSQPKKIRTKLEVKKKPKEEEPSQPQPQPQPSTPSLPDPQPTDQLSPPSNDAIPALKKSSTVPTPAPSLPPGPDSLSPSVRASLMLLKTRNRNRRSVSDIESDSQPLDPSSSIASRPPPPTHNLPLPIQDRRIPPRPISTASSASGSASTPDPTSNDSTEEGEEEDEQEEEEEKEEDQVEESNQEEGERQTCPDCQRRFLVESFAKHSKICAKVFLQKRKVFDSRKKRVQDPEQKSLLDRVLKEEKKGSRGASAAATAKESKWKHQSESFREGLRAARAATKAIAEGKPLPPPVISAPDPSLIPCPHCGRRFNEKAAERHIPLCNSIKAKPTALKRGAKR